MRLIPILVLACCAPFVFAQEDSFETKCSVGEDTVDVHVKKVPDLKQSCYEVSYKDQKGYLCVWAGGTLEREYGYTRELNPEDVTEQGLNPRSGNFGYSVSDGFNRLCNRLVSDYRREQAQKEFNPTIASEQLDDFFKSKPTSQTQ